MKKEKKSKQAGDVIWYSLNSVPSMELEWGLRDGKEKIGKCPGFSLIRIIFGCFCLVFR